MDAAPHPGPWSHRALLTPSARYLAVFVMAVSFVFPVEGLGVDLCLLHATTGLPCPGCGLSRGIAAISQGDLATAVALNPFALLAWPVFLVLAAVTLAPARVYARFESFLERKQRPIGLAYRLAFWAFVGFGALRFALFLASGARFP